MTSENTCIDFVQILEIRRSAWKGKCKVYYNLLQLYENLQCLGFLKIKMLSIIQAGLFYLHIVLVKI